jgi:hypothetical protein
VVRPTGLTDELRARPITVSRGATHRRCTREAVAETAVFLALDPDAPRSITFEMQDDPRASAAASFQDTAGLRALFSALPRDSLPLPDVDHRAPVRAVKAGLVLTAAAALYGLFALTRRLMSSAE